MSLPAAALAGYLVGAIPVAFLVARLWGGIDIRRHGSGNPGATNVGRVLGRGPGFLCLGLDILKGWAPAAYAASGGEAVGIAAAVGVVAGHAWPVFLNFRGGRGVATAAGAFLALAPVEFLWAAASFAAVFLPTFVVSASSVAAATALAAAALVLRGPTPTALVAAALSALVVVRHLPNLRRLVEGTEAPIGRGATGLPSAFPFRVLLAFLVAASAAVAWALVP